MTTKAQFNAEEWSTVVQAPLIAGLRLATAERGGTLRESMSIARVYAEARREQGTSSLLDEIVSSPPSVPPQQLGTSEDLSRTSVERVREAVALVRAKATPEEADAYGRFVVELAQRVANAHKEGGFLGVGGKPISDSEQAALDELSDAVEARA